jgi:uncharacterized membrane protein HdeD (DUF308 family)
VSGRKENDDWWVLLLVGLAGIVIGVLTFYNPQATALAVILWMIAVYAVAFGVVLVLLAFRVRRGVKRIAGALGA